MKGKGKKRSQLRPAPVPQPAGEHPFAPTGRWLMVAFGLVMLALAGATNYTSMFMFAGHMKVFLRFPGMHAKEYYFIPIWWVAYGLPLVMFGLGMVSRRFRQALAAPWRSARYGVPVAFSLAFLLFSLYPWEYFNMPIWECGSKMIFHVLVGGSGVVLLMAGLHDKLKFLDNPLGRHTTG